MAMEHCAHTSHQHVWQFRNQREGSAALARNRAQFVISDRTESIRRLPRPHRALEQE
jgi:hypothetical protein